jgi:hypothetical protein
MKKFNIIVLTIVAIIIIIIIGFALWQKFVKEEAPSVINISNFEECASAGYPVAESYPRQCFYNNQTFVEIIDQNILPFDSGVAGQVLLGPTCPGPEDPSNPNCDDKPYQITIQVVVIGSPQSSPFATVETDKDGNYKIMLPPGEYALNPIENSQHPICESISVTVKPNLISNANISCDTGIR